MPLGLAGYRISNLGRAWSDKTARILKSHVHPTTGYLQISPWDNGRPHPRFLHREVLRLFVGPKPPGMECAHYPLQCRFNNALSNLKYASERENRQMAERAGLRSPPGGPPRTGRPGKLTPELIGWIMARRAEGLGAARICRGLLAQHGLQISCTTIERLLRGGSHNWVTGLPVVRPKHPNKYRCNETRRKAQRARVRRTKQTLAGLGPEPVPEALPVFQGDRLVGLRRS